MAVQNILIGRGSKFPGAGREALDFLLRSGECQGADEASTFQEEARRLAGQQFESRR
jgi:hypothetical protein